MERNFYNDEFEEFLKQKADQYKLYPSERVWSNVYSSLHNRKRWFTLGLLLLLITSTLIVSREILLSNYARVAQKVNESITQTSNSNKRLVSANNESPVIVLSANKASINTLSNGRSSKQNNTTPNTGNILNAGTITIPENANETTALVIGNGSMPAESEFDYTGRTNIREATRIALALPLPAINSKKPKNSKPSVQNDDAAANINPASKSKWSLQLYASPIVSYRRLSNLNRNSKFVPVAINFDNNIDDYVRHKPAIGFELGTKVQYNLTNSLSLYVGAQLNYSRYYIDAYNYHTEKASIALNSFPVADTVSKYTSIRNFEGYYPEQLQNQYFQLSMPIGAELKLLGNRRLQLSIAGSIQPTYLISSNSYLLSSDFKNYVQNPDLARKFNVHTNFEAFVSYRIGGLKWQLGPQFRYQLLSSYTNEYAIREYLTEFGFKLGVSKTIK